MTLWLAFDIGTTGTKAALVEAEGESLRVLKTAYRAYETHYFEGGSAEQDARDWWRAACEAAHELDASRVEAIAITGQMQNVILIDAAGEPVRPVILYMDGRAVKEAEFVAEQIGGDVFLRIMTGNQQTANGLFAKLRWLAAHDMPSLEQASHLLMGAADFVAYHLTGIAASDTTTASTTGLINLEERTWFSRNLYASAQIGGAVRLFPRLVPGGSQVGATHQSGANPLGVRAGIPVYLAPGDAGATTLGIGSGVPGIPYGYIGTSGWVGYTSSQRGSIEKGVITIAHPDPELVICVAPMLTAGGNFDWARETLGFTDVGGMIESALAASPTNLIYLPYLNGERSPFSDPHARGSFIGLSRNHTREDMARAVLEGVAFTYKHALDALISEPVDLLGLTGGGTRSAGFGQLVADVTGVRVVLPDDAANTGLRGAIMAAQVKRGEREGFRLPESASATFTPDPEMTTLYARKYAWFRDAYPALKGLFGEMQTL